MSKLLAGKEKSLNESLGYNSIKYRLSEDIHGKKLNKLFIRKKKIQNEKPISAQDSQVKAPVSMKILQSEEGTAPSVAAVPSYSWISLEGTTRSGAYTSVMAVVVCLAET